MQNAADRTRLSQAEYDAAFEVSKGGPERAGSATNSTDKQEKALHQALDIRKFEIQLYWTRAAYFWAFNTLALGGYGALQTGSVSKPPQLSVLVSCIGLLCSFAWYFANRGSKQWQENWENHVDLLEDRVTGPLYKVVIRRPLPKTFIERTEALLVGPAAYSVSRINQILSLYITILWMGLLAGSFAGAWHSLLAWFGLILTLLACAAIYYLGRTYDGSNRNEAWKRRSTVD